MCEIIRLDEKTTAIICDRKDHKCDEKATVYGTRKGERFYFKDDAEGKRWYDKNYRDVTMGSVACSICGGAMIDKAMRM